LLNTEVDTTALNVDGQLSKLMKNTGNMKLRTRSKGLLEN